jgi:drug/metabolite transporter (DMT)-like permease
MLRPTARPYVWMLLGAASFSVMSILTVALKERMDWQWIALARAGLAMIFAAVLAKGASAQLVFFKPAKLWMRSIAGSISLVCGFYAMTHYPVSEVLTLTNMFPLWVVVLSLPLLGHWPPADVWPAVLMGIVGVVLIQSAEGGQFSGGSMAVVAALVCSVTSAIALIGLHQVRELDPRAVVVHFSAVAVVFCVAALFFLPHQHAIVFDLQTAGLLLLLGAFATIGQLFLTKAFAAGPPARVSVVMLSQVAFTMLLEIAIWHRSFSARTLVGIVLVIVPTAWTLLRGAMQQTAEDEPLALRKAA